MSLQQACDHSLSQLKLLERGADRVASERALLDSQIAFSAAAAPWSKEAGSMMKTIQNHLLKNVTE